MFKYSCITSDVFHRLLPVRIMCTLLLALAASPAARPQVTVGAARPEVYKPLLEGRQVGLLSNHTGVVDGRHTVDLLLSQGINVTTLFSPEHGFRGTADAGEHVKGSVDTATGLPVVSLYGGGRSNPLPDAIKPLDVVVVDLQDVGTRFYTYYITMIKVIEEAGRQGKRVVIFDRPNPLGMVVDGPVLDMTLRSGVGRLPIPVVHGMTLGELALMAAGEGWLAEGMRPQIDVVKCDGYTHATRYELPVAPSPNLRDMTAIYLYPSTCLFEGTTASVGRGTDMPFKVYGHPLMADRGFTFTPRSVPGAKNPPHLGKPCHGVDLASLPHDSIIARGLTLDYIIDAYNAMPRAERKRFITPFFDKLIGNRRVRSMITSGSDAATIKATWADDVARFKKARSPYLLYPLN